MLVVVVWGILHIMLYFSDIVTLHYEGFLYFFADRIFYLLLFSSQNKTEAMGKSFNLFFLVGGAVSFLHPVMLCSQHPAPSMV